MKVRKDLEADIKNQPIVILREIKEISHNYQDSWYPIASILKAIKYVVNIKLYRKESLVTFTKYCKNYKDIMDTQHGRLTLSKYTKTLPKYNESKLEKVRLDSE